MFLIWLNDLILDNVQLNYLEKLIEFPDLSLIVLSENVDKIYIENEIFHKLKEGLLFYSLLRTCLKLEKRF